MRIVNSFNKVGNEFSVSSDGVAVALQSSASALASANNDLESSIALVAAANRVVQDEAEVGAGLRTISLRLRGTSVSELEELGEDTEGAVESVSKLQGKLLALTGVNILNDDNSYKSTYEILLAISEVYSTLDDQSKAATLELIAGKNRSNVASALLTNTKDLKEAYEAAVNSENSAAKELDTYLSSIEGRVAAFNNSLQTMWNNALQSDFIKDIVEIGTWLVRILDTLGPIQVLLSGIFVYFNKKYNFVDFEKFFAGFKDAFTDSKSPKEFFKNLIKGFKNTGISIDEARAKLDDLQKQRDMLGDPKSARNQKKYDQLTDEIKAIEEEIKAYDSLMAKRDEAVKNREAAKAKMDAANADLANEWSQGEFGMADEAELDRLQRKVDETTEAFEEADLKVRQLETDINSTGKSGKGAFAGLGKSVAAFGKQVASVLAQMLIMLAITKIIEAATKFFDDIITTAEEAAEAYETLNDELDTLKNTIKDINGEISTLNDKIAELTAKDSLTFAEKEELERLREEREELERTLELNQQLAKQKQNQVNGQTSDQIEYYKSKGVDSGKTVAENTHEAGSATAIAGGAITAATAMAAFGGTMSWNVVGWVALAAAAVTAVVGGIAYAVASAEETIGESIDNMEANLKEKEEAVEKARAAYQKSGSDKDKKKYEEAQQALSDYRGEMAQYFTEMDAMYQKVDLGTIEDPDEYQRLKAEMEAFYNERDKWLIESGASGAEANAIERIFSKDEYKNASDTIDTLVAKLKEDPTNQTLITQISDQCKAAATDLEAVGLSTKDAIDYFALLGQNAAFGTLEGKTSELQLATSKLQTLLSNTKSADFTKMFGQGGEVNTEAIAQYFQGTSEATRAEIAKLVKGINDGEISVAQALKSFAAYGMVESWKIVEAQVSELNADVFGDLGDEISGVIDTVKELSAAFESVASSIELVDKAQAEMAYSGHLSVETALQLMESTDDWNEVLKIENGNIKLVSGAEEALVQTKLDLIKTNLQTALSTVEAQLAQLTATETSLGMATTIEESTNVAVRELSGNMAYLTEMMKAYASAASGEKVDMNAAIANAEKLKQKVLDDTNYVKNSAEITGREDLEKEKARLEAMLGIVETADTPAEFRSNYSSDEVSGGNATKEDVSKSKWDELVAEYERRLALLSNERDLIQAEIDKAEARGGKASAKYYEDLKNNSEAEKEILIQKKKALQEYLDANEGSIDQDTWTEYNNEINATAVAIKECEINTLEWAEALREIDLHYFEQATDEISRLGEELEFVNSLLEDEEVADENGNWSSAALTRMGMYTQQMEMAAVNAARYQEEIDRLNGQYKSGELSEEQYQERLSELVSSQQGAIQSYEDAKDGIVELNEARIDAIRTGIEQEISAFEDLISLKKEELDAERD